MVKKTTQVFLLVLIMTAGGRAEEVIPAEAVTDQAPEQTIPVLDAQDVAALEMQVGNPVVVEGVIEGVGSTGDGGITFLNFGANRKGFVAVVFQAAYANFPEGLDSYAQQKVRVHGTLESYRDRQIQIKVVTADQLEIMENLEPAPTQP